MQILNHLGRKLSALAVTGGTAFALFGGAPAHTQFSATTGGTATVSGATVAVAPSVLQASGNYESGGNLTCGGLVPPTAASGTTANPIPATSGTECTSTIHLQNTGNTSEDLAFAITDITAGNTKGATAIQHLGQLGLAYTVTRASTTLTGNYNNFSTSGTGGQSLSMGTVGAGKTATLKVTFSLGANTGTNQNAWNGAEVSIPYTITATPAA